MQLVGLTATAFQVIKDAINNRALKTKVTTTTDGLMSKEDKSKLDGFGGKGVAGGIASLGADGKVPSAQLPPMGSSLPQNSVTFTSSGSWTVPAGVNVIQVLVANGAGGGGGGGGSSAAVSSGTNTVQSSGNGGNGGVTYVKGMQLSAVISAGGSVGWGWLSSASYTPSMGGVMGGQNGSATFNGKAAGGAGGTSGSTGKVGTAGAAAVCNGYVSGAGGGSSSYSSSLLMEVTLGEVIPIVVGAGGAGGSFVSYDSYSGTTFRGSVGGNGAAGAVKIFW